MTKKELVEKLKNIQLKMKNKKKDDYDEYLNLKNERLKLEAELNQLKKKYYSDQEQATKIKIRKLNDHFKFLLGGLVIRDNSKILEKYNTQEKLEKLKFKIVENIKADDISEYFNSINES